MGCPWTLIPQEVSFERQASKYDVSKLDMGCKGFLFPSHAIKYQIVAYIKSNQGLFQCPNKMELINKESDETKNMVECLAKLRIIGKTLEDHESKFFTTWKEKGCANAPSVSCLPPFDNLLDEAWLFTFCKEKKMLATEGFSLTLSRFPPIT